MFTTVSIGIALGSTDYEGPEELLRDADIAMYHAKALGKDRYGGVQLSDAHSRRHALAVGK